MSFCSKVMSYVKNMGSGEIEGAGVVGAAALGWSLGGIPIALAVLGAYAVGRRPVDLSAERVEWQGPVQDQEPLKLDPDVFLEVDQRARPKNIGTDSVANCIQALILNDPTVLQELPLAIARKTRLAVRFDEDTISKKDLLEILNNLRRDINDLTDDEKDFLSLLELYEFISSCQTENRGRQSLNTLKNNLSQLGFKMEDQEILNTFRSLIESVFEKSKELKILAKYQYVENLQGYLIHSGYGVSKTGKARESIRQTNGYFEVETDGDGSLSERFEKILNPPGEGSKEFPTTNNGEKKSFEIKRRQVEISSPPSRLIFNINRGPQDAKEISVDQYITIDKKNFVGGKIKANYELYSVIQSKYGQYVAHVKKTGPESKTYFCSDQCVESSFLSGMMRAARVGSVLVYRKVDDVDSKCSVM